ncbi:MAG TPA: aldehyde reductase, partial [Dermatophilaceae bacterium]
MSGELVLVTGGSGFVGSNCLVAALRDGFQVRTTVRSMVRADEVRAMVTTGGQDGGAVEFVTADLTSDAGWPEAVAGVDYVLHVASPFPVGVPKDPDELIVPARDGVLRVLRAATDSGVKRVVQTSSFAAIGYGHVPQARPFTEDDWTDLSGADPVAAYPTSKTLAERAAWDFVAEHPEVELATVNPVGIFGPALGGDTGTSLEIVKRLLGGLPGVPDLSFGVVDVRDVADLHVLAMTRPEAAGERFLATSGDFMSMLEMARILRTGIGDRARKVPTRVLPNALIRLAGRFDSGMAQLATELGQLKNASGKKAERVLGWM